MDFRKFIFGILVLPYFFFNFILNEDSLLRYFIILKEPAIVLKEIYTINSFALYIYLHHPILLFLCAFVLLVAMIGAIVLAFNVRKTKYQLLYKQHFVNPKDIIVNVNNSIKDKK